MEDIRRQQPDSIGQIAWSVAAVGLVAFLLLRVLPANSMTAALVFMLIVLLVSAYWTLWEAIATALAASLVLDYYFLPPVGFRIADPNDIVALIAFILCALVGSQLALTARRRAVDANHSRDEMERLYALSRAFLLIPKDTSAPKLVAFQLVHLFGFPGVALYLFSDGQVYRCGPTAVNLTTEEMHEAATAGSGRTFPGFSGSVLPLKYHGMRVGALAVVDRGKSSTTTHAIADLAAIALFRAQQVDTVAP